MPPDNSVVLIDTMAIKIAHDVGCWNALRKKFRLHTVSQCVHEATRRNGDGKVLVNKSLEGLASELTIGVVDRKKSLELRMQVGSHADLNEGELNLLAFALTLPDAWCLCGPDEGTVRAMKLLTIIHKMVSLESLMKAIGHSTKNLKYHFSEAWLSNHRLSGVLEAL